MGRLTPQPEPSGDIEYADGHTPCPHCDATPLAGDPWSQVRIGTTWWPKACIQCALDNDDGLRPRRAEEDDAQ